jgi:hypothetical protein
LGDIVLAFWPQVIFLHYYILRKELGMDIETEILNSVTPAFISVYCLLNIVGLVCYKYKDVRVRLYPYISLMAVFVIALELIGGEWLFAGIFTLTGLPFFIASFTYDNKEEEGDDEFEEGVEEDPKGEPIVLEITAVAVDDRPEMPTRRTLCSHCGAPNKVVNPNMTVCAYCALPLA